MEAGPEIPFSGSYNPENARLARWMLRRSDRRSLIGALAGLLLVLLLFIAYPPIRGLNAAIILGCGLANIYIFLIQPEVRTGKDWKFLKRQIPVTGRLTDSGFEIHWEGSESRSSWSGFQNGRVKGSLILFEDITGRPYYLPRSFFATESDWQRAGTQIGIWTSKRNASTAA